APVWKAFHIGVRLRHGQAVQTGKTTIRVAGDVVHTIALYVIDPGGQERYGYLPPFRPAAVAAAVSSVSWSVCPSAAGSSERSRISANAITVRSTTLDSIAIATPAICWSARALMSPSLGVW